MPNDFKFDVFLSHSSKDKPVVRILAERLRKDGLKVWFDEWEVWPGDLIGLKIEQGLQTSRALVLCVSVNALDSDWVTLERHAAMFRDPANKQRRFIPLVLDDAVLSDALKQFAHVDWRFKSEDQYARLLTVCRSVASDIKTTLVTHIEADQQQNHQHPLFHFWSRLWAKSLGSKRSNQISSQKIAILPQKPNAPDYEICDSPFGEGAYGKVWLARNAIGRWQALKAVYVAKFGESTAPYEREFRGITNFKPLSELHPGLLRIDFVSRKKPEGYFYYVMELGDALQPGWEQNPGRYRPRDLSTVLARAESKYLPVSECLRIGLALSDTLDFLHKKGVTHRDIKPSNIIFVNGHPKLADVGLVTEIRAAETDGARTYLGTPGYIPPRPESTGTPQADIYALGMLLYKIATGNEPAFFPEITAALLNAPNNADFFRLNSVILKACHPDCAIRYLSAAQLHSALLEIREIS
jgi:TIR domain/Protein kinase domain